MKIAHLVPRGDGSAPLCNHLREQSFPGGGLVIAEHRTQLRAAELCRDDVVHTFFHVEIDVLSLDGKVGRLPAAGREFIFDKIFDIAAERAERKDGAHLVGEGFPRFHRRLFRFVADKPQRGGRAVPERQQRFIVRNDGINQPFQLPLVSGTVFIVCRHRKFGKQFGGTLVDLSSRLLAEIAQNIFFQKVQLGVLVIHIRVGRKSKPPSFPLYYKTKMPRLSIFQKSF